MADLSSFRLQLGVFALVSASFTNVYITQPVLPLRQQEVAAGRVLVSLSISAVISGIALSAMISVSAMCMQNSVRPERSPLIRALLVGLCLEIFRNIRIIEALTVGGAFSKRFVSVGLNEKQRFFQPLQP